MKCEISSTYYYMKDNLLEKYPFLNEFDIEEIRGVNDYGFPYTKSYITVNSLEDLRTIMRKADEANPVYFEGLLLDEIDGELAIEIRDDL